MPSRPVVRAENRPTIFGAGTGVQDRFRKGDSPDGDVFKLRI